MRYAALGRRRARHHDHRRDRRRVGAASRPAGVHRRAGDPVWLLHRRHHHLGGRAVESRERPERRADRRRAGAQSLPLRHACPHPARHPLRGARDANARQDMTPVALPQSLKTTPRLDRWVRFNADRTVTVFSGKVELGQGIETAIAQIAAEELDVSLERLQLVAGDTTRSPDEWYTAGSQSIEVGGAAMRLACAEVRSLFLEAAARELEVNVGELAIRDGAIEVAGTDLSTSYWDLAPRVDLAREATGGVQPKAPAQHRLVGTSAPRRDLHAKITGWAYVHDLELPGMVFGRVLRPPSYTVRLRAFDAEAIRVLPGVVAVTVSGNFIGLCAEREEQAVAALEAARKAATWDEQPGLPATNEIRDILPAMPSVRSIVHEKGEA